MSTEPEGARFVNYVRASDARIVKALAATQVAINDGALNAPDNETSALFIGTCIKSYAVPGWMAGDMDRAATILLGQYFAIILAKVPESGPESINMLYMAATEGKELV